VTQWTHPATAESAESDSTSDEEEESDEEFSRIFTSTETNGQEGEKEDVQDDEKAKEEKVEAPKKRVADEDDGPSSLFPAPTGEDDEETGDGKRQKKEKQPTEAEGPRKKLVVRDAQGTFDLSSSGTNWSPDFLSKSSTDFATSSSSGGIEKTPEDLSNRRSPEDVFKSRQQHFDTAPHEALPVWAIVELTLMEFFDLDSELISESSPSLQDKVPLPTLVQPKSTAQNAGASNTQQPSIGGGEMNHADFQTGLGLAWRALEAERRAFSADVNEQTDTKRKYEREAQRLWSVWVRFFFLFDLLCMYL